VLAFEHQSAVKYLDLVVDGDTIAARMTVAPSDLAEPLGLAPDARPSAIAAATPAAARYTRSWVTVGGCAPSAEHAAPDLDGRFVAVTWTLACASLGGELDLDLSAFFAVDPRHEAIVRVDGNEPIVIRAATPQWSIPIGGQKSSWAFWLLVPAGVLGIGLVALLRRPGT
jgi:hypothetical protein